MSNTNADAAEPAATWTALESLRPWSENPRKNKGRPVEDTVASLIRFGWGRPMVARKGELVVGHTARLAALELPNRWRNASETERKSWHPEAIRTAETGQVPTRHRDDLSESEAHLLALADNRLGEHSDWDMDALPDIFETEGWGADDLAVAGWNAEELANISPIGAWSGVEDVDLPEIGEADGPQHKSLTFHVTTEQCQIIEEAIGRASTAKGKDARGDALTRIAEVFLGTC